MAKTLATTPLRCPSCGHSPLRLESDASVSCPECSTHYHQLNGRPVLIQTGNTLFPPASFREGTIESKRGGRLARLVPSPSLNFSYEPSMRTLGRLLESAASARVLVVGSGLERARLAKLMKDVANLQLVAVDVDQAADVDIWCDAHDLPFADDSFDAVVATAVLEHVLYPERVMEEIARVVRPGGFLYSEIPFLQQVHEGPYDFTRYTLSGHRRLAAAFEEIDSGAVAGPATSLTWAIEHFALSFAGTGRSRSVVKGLVRLAFFWLKHLDRLLVRRDAALDGAACTYFLGRRRSGGRTPDAAIISGYVGAQTRDMHA